METSGCAPAEEYLCQAFSDVILAVNDVDAEDGADPNLCSEYVKDIYAYLRQLEVSIVVSLLFFKLHLILLKILITLGMIHFQLKVYSFPDKLEFEANPCKM
jgi:hypothetical protein